MRGARAITKKLYIEELESPARAEIIGGITTDAIGEESFKGLCASPGAAVTLKVGEDCIKA